MGLWKSVIESVESDGYVTVGAETYHPEYGSDTLITQATIAKVSLEGDSLWMRRYSWRSGPSAQDRFNDVIVTSDGGYAVSGQSSNSGPEIEDDLPWINSIIIKLDKDGLLDTTRVSAIQLNASSPVTIHPNPARDYLYLTQDSNGPLDVSIFSFDGRLVDTFRSLDHTHTQVLDVTRFSSGIYLIKVRDRDANEYTHRVVVE